MLGLRDAPSLLIDVLGLTAEQEPEKGLPLLIYHARRETYQGDEKRARRDPMAATDGVD